MKTFNWWVDAPHAEILATCKFPEDAAALVALYGPGARILYMGQTSVWVEGNESQDAGESYDHVAETVIDRAKKLGLLP